MPILNLKLLCGPDQLNISLWRDEALCDLHIGDDVEITHLYSDMVPRGRGNFHSSQYTTVKVIIIQSLQKYVRHTVPLSIYLSIYHTQAKYTNSYSIQITPIIHIFDEIIHLLATDNISHTYMFGLKIYIFFLFFYRLRRLHVQNKKLKF